MRSMKSKKLPKPRKGAWFVPVRGSYLPATWQWWFLYVPYILYVVLVCLVVLSGKEPLVTRIIMLVPYLVSGLVIMTWIAARKS